MEKDFSCMFIMETKNVEVTLFFATCCWLHIECLETYNVCLKYLGDQEWIKCGSGEQEITRKLRKSSH